MPFIEYTKENFDCINTNRTRIGLDSFHVSQRQFICQGIMYHPNYKTSRFVFEPYVEIIHYPTFLFKDINKALKANRIKMLDEKMAACPCICNDN